MSSNNNTSAAPGTESRTGVGRFGIAHAVVVTAFPLAGSALAVTGMPVADVLQLLGGCGGIGAGVVLIITGGRKAVVAIAQGVLNANAK
ncbi:hypothetical protein ACQEVG_02480 [Streptomyces sp. CA-135486]|uniref:hypothetical protein n=1 Tax=Streptomyces sp. CA-135486 TaxID=3240049 RepID=UPI003D8DF3DC